MSTYGIPAHEHTFEPVLSRGGKLLGWACRGCHVIEAVCPRMQCPLETGGHECSVKWKALVEECRKAGRIEVG